MPNLQLKTFETKSDDPIVLRFYLEKGKHSGHLVDTLYNVTKYLF